MANWTSIADATLEPGKPIRAIDARALRDNPIAIAEGASGAPKIETAGITDLNVTTAKLAAGAVTTAKITDANVTTAKLEAGERMTTANVLGSTAGATAGAVGTYALLSIIAGTANQTAGATLAASNLGYSNADGISTGTVSGTWRLMGRTVVSSLSSVTSVFLRIS
jgi:hypothetical protein